MRGVTCLNCKRECSTESHNCKRCGRPLPTVCLKCNTENPWHLAECLGCGTNLLSQELKEEKLAVDEEFVDWLKSYLNSADKNAKTAVA